MSILHCAAFNNHTQIAQFIQDTVDHYDMNQLNKDERTPLHIAADKGNLAMLDKLLDCKCEVNKKDKVRVYSYSMHAPV